MGGYIFSKDGKILLDKTRNGRVCEGYLVIPGGGVNEGETKLDALRREMLEETGLEINEGIVTELNISAGEHKKTLQDTGERVFVKMDFYDYKIKLSQIASEIVVQAEDDWTDPQWFNPSELKDLKLSPPVRKTLLKTGILIS